MAIISGTLTDGAGQIINSCTIELYAKKTTSNVLTQTQVFRVTENGKYEINVLPCNYEVNLIIDGFPKKKLGTIQVFADSADGTLNDYLLNPTESEITPEILQQVIDARNKSEQSAKIAKESVDVVVKNAENANSSATQALASSTSASNASKSATAAKTSETNAKNSATQAATSATSADNSKTAAATSETNATKSATAAKTSETNAKTSETSAAASAEAAKKSAESLDTSGFVKKAGDWMSNQLGIESDTAGVAYKNKAGQQWLSRIFTNGDLAFMQYDPVTAEWAYKFRYVGSIKKMAL